MQQMSAVLQRTAADTQLSWPAQTVATETRVYNSIVSGPIQTQSPVLSQYPLTDEQNCDRLLTSWIFEIFESLVIILLMYLIY